MRDAFRAITLGIFAWEEPGEADALLGRLDPRRRALLVAGASYHALLNPGALLELIVEESSSWRMYLASDDPTEKGVELGRVTLRVGDGSQRIARRIVLPAEMSPEPTPEPPPTAKAWALATVERIFPIWGDEIRQRRNSSQRAASDAARRPPRTPPVRHAWTPRGGPRAVLFGMYWLGRGGAESWALQTVDRAAEAGLVPLVVTDVAGMQELAGDDRLREALVLVLDDAHHPRTADLLDALDRIVDLRAAFVHHSNWLYGALPLVRAMRPQLEVVDSTHVIEWGNGGFPMVAGRADEYIDVHHVISEELVSYLEHVEGVHPGKIVRAPLAASATATAAERPGPVAPGGPFTVGFVGRLVPQKRPLLFLATVRRLRRGRRRFPLRAIMHGGGPLEGELRRWIARWRLTRVVDVRPPTDDVASSYREMNALLVSSQVEGLTLTTMEATAAGIPVVSARVGAQAELVANDALVSRTPRDFVNEASAVLDRLAHDIEFRSAVVEEQRAKLAELRRRTTADEWFEETLRRWTR